MKEEAQTKDKHTSLESEMAAVLREWQIAWARFGVGRFGIEQYEAIEEKTQCLLAAYHQRDQ